MESSHCKFISFFLSSMYRITAAAGLLMILITGEAMLSGMLIGAALVLFSGSYYVEAMLCRSELKEPQQSSRNQAQEYRAVAQHIESSRQR